MNTGTPALLNKETPQTEKAGFRYLIPSTVKLVTTEGDVTSLKNLHTEYKNTPFTILTLCDNKLVKRTGTLTPHHNLQPLKMVSLTTSKGMVFVSSEGQNIRIGNGDTQMLSQLDVGDVLHTGSLRYENSVFRPSLTTELNFVIEKRTIITPNTIFYELTIDAENVITGQELDGETSILCLTPSL